MIIRRFSAGLLLLLFLFGVTPKKILHDLFAHHKDLTSHTSGDAGGAQVANSGFSCNCESQVIESPFTEALSPVELILPSLSWLEKFSRIENVFYRAPGRCSGLRGPPAV